MKGRVVVGLSGGVDSSVAALLLRDAGWDVLGVFMKNWEEAAETEGAEGPGPGACTATADADDARAVCDVLGIPFYAVNLSRAYYDRVFLAFLRGVEAGLTPNPDVLCNSEVKFGAFLDFARSADADFLATGHFARVERGGGGIRLLRGADGNKDQSYFLSGLSQNQLARALFPVGHLHKAEVRALAAAAGLPTAAKRDSTGICFIGERRFREFLSRYVAAKPGEIVDREGRVVGQHMGVAFYTLGQRRGLGIGGGHSPDGSPLFVVGKDIARNRLIVAPGGDPALWTSVLTVRGLHWIGGPPAPDAPLACKIRYRQPDQPCALELLGARARVAFARPQRAATPGQYAVFYDGEVCLGCGVIEDAAPAKE